MDYPQRSLVHRNKIYLVNLLQAANKGKRTLKNALIHSSEEEIETLVEIVRNFLAASEPFKNACSKDYIKRMSNYTRLIRALAENSTSAKFKQAKIVKNQKGGALIASLLIPIVSSLVSAIISNKL